MSSAAFPADSDRPETPDATTAEGVPCVRCGYALVGLPEAGDCPECGTAIRVSLAGDRIVAADPRWLDQVQSGLRLLQVGVLAAGGSLAAFYGLLLIGLLGMFLGTLISITWPPVLESADEMLMSGLLFLVPAGTVAAAVGGWLITTAEPRDAERERPRAARPIARWGPALAVAFGAAAPVLKSSLPAPHDLIAWFAAFMGAALTAGLGLAALGERLRQLSARVPSSELADRFADESRWYRSTMRLTVGALGIRLAGVVLGLAAPAIAASVVAQLLDSLATLVVLFVVLATMIHVVRLARRAADLRRAMIEARRTDDPA